MNVFSSYFYFHLVFSYFHLCFYMINFIGEIINVYKAQGVDNFIWGFKFLFYAYIGFTYSKIKQCSITFYIYSFKILYTI